MRLITPTSRAGQLLTVCAITDEVTEGRINLTVRGTVTQCYFFKGCFRTLELSTYRAPDGQEFYSANVEPVVPSEIASRISGAIGLNRK